MHANLKDDRWRQGFQLCKPFGSCTCSNWVIHITHQSISNFHICHRVAHSQTGTIIAVCHERTIHVRDARHIWCVFLCCSLMCPVIGLAFHIHCASQHLRRQQCVLLIELVCVERCCLCLPRFSILLARECSIHVLHQLQLVVPNQICSTRFSLCVSASHIQ